MSDFLERLALRTVHSASQVRPRVAMLYEALPFDPITSATRSVESGAGSTAAAGSGAATSAIRPSSPSASRRYDTSGPRETPPVPAEHSAQQPLDETSPSDVAVAALLAPSPDGSIASLRGATDRGVGRIEHTKADVESRSGNDQALAGGLEVQNQRNPAPVAPEQVAVRPGASAGTQLSTVNQAPAPIRPAAEPRAIRPGSAGTPIVPPIAQPAVPAIRVTIGRVEVRAVSPPPASPRRSPRPPAEPKLSLGDHLRARSRELRGER